MLTLRPADVVHEAVQPGEGCHLVPAQLGRALGQAGSASFLEATLLNPGGIEDGLVVRLSGYCSLADLVPVQELGFHVALRIELAGVNQVGDEQVLLFPGGSGLFSRRAWVRGSEG